MPLVFVTNEHVLSGKRYFPGDEYEAPEGSLPWLESAKVAVKKKTAEELWSQLEGRVLTPDEIPTTYKAKTRGDAKKLKVLQLTYYDPGSAAYRYHSALNASGVAISAFVRFGHSNPHCDLRQHDGETQREDVRTLLLTADAVLVHMDYRTLYHGMNQWPGPNTRLFRLYHGSSSPAEPKYFVENEKDTEHGAIQLGARLYHSRFSNRMNWLPIPMPVYDYGSSPLRESGSTLRLAHSPTNRGLKGTDVLERVVHELQLDGVPIELVMIENMAHGEALRLKQTCHATFDSFWLGLQGSGLEASCMGQIAIAGDGAVKHEYEQAIGSCPYTFADPDQLKDTIRRAVEDEAWRRAEAARTRDYVLKFHEYKAVGKRFADICRQEGVTGGAADND